MRRLLYWAAICALPGGICIAAGVWLYRRLTVANAVRVYRRENPGRVQPKAEA